MLFEQLAFNQKNQCRKFYTLAYRWKQLKAVKIVLNKIR